MEYSVCRTLCFPCSVAKDFVDFSMVACLKSFAESLNKIRGMSLSSLAVFGIDCTSEQRPEEV